MRIAAFISVCLLVLVVGSSAALGQSGVNCAAWANPTGDDANAGTRQSPWKTVAKLSQVLGPGQTGCLEPGAVFVEHLVIGGQGKPGAPIRIMTPSGANATIADGVEFLQSSHFFVLSRVAVSMTGNEPANALPAVVKIGGFQNQLIRSDISGGGVVDKSRTCVLIDHGNLILVDRNAIHGCGVIKNSPNIVAPAIHVATGSNAKITNNVIFSTPGDGVVLFPNAKDALVSRNIIDSTANGVFFGGDAKFNAKNNRVLNNIFSFVPGHGVYSGTFVTGGSAGTNNLASSNCFWKIGRIPVGGPGVNGKANRSVDPQFQNRPATFALKQSSPCWKNRPLP
jgi:hypothetical protein